MDNVVETNTGISKVESETDNNNEEDMCFTEYGYVKRISELPDGITYND